MLEFLRFFTRVSPVVSGDPFCIINTSDVSKSKEGGLK